MNLLVVSDAYVWIADDQMEVSTRTAREVLSTPRTVPVAPIVFLNHLTSTAIERL